MRGRFDVVIVVLLSIMVAGGVYEGARRLSARLEPVEAVEIEAAPKLPPCSYCGSEESVVEAMTSTDGKRVRAMCINCKIANSDFVYLLRVKNARALEAAAKKNAQKQTEVVDTKKTDSIVSKSEEKLEPEGGRRGEEEGK